MKSFITDNLLLSCPKFGGVYSGSCLPIIMAFLMKNKSELTWTLFFKFTYVTDITGQENETDSGDSSFRKVCLGQEHFLRDGAALGMGIPEKRSISRDQGLVRDEGDSGQADGDLEVTLIQLPALVLLHSCGHVSRFVRPRSDFPLSRLHQFAYSIIFCWEVQRNKYYLHSLFLTQEYSNVDLLTYKRCFSEG